MATRKASDSNLTGKKYNDASAGATKIPDLPQVPTSPVATGAAQPTVSFTAAIKGGVASSYVIDNDFNGTTWSGASTPVTATGLTPGTTLRFRVKAVNATGESDFTGYTSAVSVSGWALAQTFNSTSNWSVPTGISQIGVIVVGGGQAGGNASISGSGNIGGGGRGAAAGGFKDYAVNSGTNYLVTVGAAGGTSSFGNLLSAGPNGTATSNVGGATLQASVGGGGAGSYPNGWASAAANSAGPISLAFSAPFGTQTVQYGGGGGGASYGNGPSYGGGSPYGGGGGWQGAGGAANGIGGGGGGAGGNANGGAGGAGRVYVYTYTA